MSGERGGTCHRNRRIVSQVALGDRVEFHSVQGICATGWSWGGDKGPGSPRALCSRAEALGVQASKFELGLAGGRKKHVESVST